MLVMHSRSGSEVRSIGMTPTNTNGRGEDSPADFDAFDTHFDELASVDAPVASSVLWLLTSFDLIFYKRSVRNVQSVKALENPDFLN